MVTRCEKPCFVFASGASAKDRKFGKLEISWQRRSELFRPVITAECNLIRRYSRFGPVPFQYILRTRKKLNPWFVLRGGETGKMYFLNVSRILSFEITTLPYLISMSQALSVYSEKEVSRKKTSTSYIFNALGTESKKFITFYFSSIDWLLFITIV